MNLGVGWRQLGDLAQARRELDAGLQMLWANSDRAVESASLCNLSTMALWQGEETRALALARQDLNIAVLVRARDTELKADLVLRDAECVN